MGKELEMRTSTAGILPAYQRLKQHHDDGYYDFEKEREVVPKARSSSGSSMISWCKLKPRMVPSVSLRRRLRLRRRVVSLRRLMQLRRKVKLACGHIRVSCLNVVKRLKDGQSHFGDLFAGNYMFLQVNPSSLKSLDQRRRNLAGGGGEQKQQPYQLQFLSFPSRTTGMGYTFPRN